MKQFKWVQKLKHDHLDPIVSTISDNLPVILTVTSTAIAVGIAMRAANDAEHTKDVLAAIEEKINVAIEAPVIVKVELGDDIELYGHGNRVD